MRFAYIRHIWECGETLEIEEKHTADMDQRTEEAEKKESNSGRYRETESVEKRKRFTQADQVEFRKT